MQGRTKRRILVNDESGSTEHGKKRVFYVDKPKLRIDKYIEKDVTYKTKESPREKWSNVETTKRFSDGSVKRYSNTIRKNGKKISEISTKQRYKKGETFNTSK
jgi:hypothetical protein